MTDRDDYMADPRAKSYEGFIVALNIFANHAKDGLKRKWPFSAEHEVLYCHDGPPQDHADAQLLSELGWHWDDDAEGWAYFT